MIQTRQSYKYESDDWWEWSVWLDGSSQELDQVEYVEYRLHRTFPKPVRVVKDRATNFRLTTGGWGCFTIYVRVVMKDSTEHKLTHDLDLQRPDGTVPTE
jgi:transcription initiation factor IIF auxiliary subunit